MARDAENLIPVLRLRRRSAEKNRLEAGYFYWGSLFRAHDIVTGVRIPRIFRNRHIRYFNPLPILKVRQLHQAALRQQQPAIVGTQQVVPQVGIPAGIGFYSSIGIAGALGSRILFRTAAIRATGSQAKRGKHQKRTGGFVA